MTMDRPIANHVTILAIPAHQVRAAVLAMLAIIDCSSLEVHTVDVQHDTTMRVLSTAWPAMLHASLVLELPRITA